MDPEGQVRQYLRDDEALLSHGVPDAGVRFTAQDKFLVPFSVLWCGASLAVEPLAVSAHAAGGVSGPGPLTAVTCPARRR
jgi:hypothetical protein